MEEHAEGGHRRKDKSKLILAIPFIILAISIIFLFVNYSTTGSFVNKGISLKGGTSISIISVGTDAIEVQNSLDYDGELNVRTLSGAGRQIGLIIELDSTEELDVNNIKEQIKNKFNIEEDQITIETIGSALGSSFFKETVRAVIFAFIFMGIVVFIYFRSIVPSSSIVLAAVSDIIITMAVVNVMGIKLSTAGVAAFLMLIGYAVDTNILLSTKVLKRKEGSVDERIKSAMKTGFMMTLTTITAIIIAIIFSQSPVITQIMTIVLIGLIVDMMNTWVQNAGILKIYVNRRKHQ
ncbi:protein translocase subunit SecF [Candidatus Woesearchaeota archaeon]|jgi:preprotein translocase subunit SecF|nr:protein translocase subunit SecF [Candidatus Woesearchaeota archaeon]MBT4368891.1 protein translocase subunit SecF [Candidatus Woesearchaeota archaeon]MBT4712180.1 protein translocase subunit SecF [Candidatus Woesearchaeota archaeon]MBT6639072.1 protein translocase subunit SecF [Candidatus Woesearchaeota archaeon]MBT7134272.1 protein translocase subunit SecF [Candidatus Woesearchaeota archaeon]